MFGKNEIVGTKYFTERAPADSLLITSVFYTIQGEGPFAGRPAVFIRLAKCNLKCSFCDTYFDQGDWWTTSGAVDLVRETHATLHPITSLPMLVVTGGEPMLQPNLIPFLEKAKHHFNAIQIESNGLILRDVPLNAHLVVSPKCAQVEGKPTHFLKPPRRVLSRANSLKFVLTADEDSPYHTVPTWAFACRDMLGTPIYVSPMAEYQRQPQVEGLLHTKEDLLARSRAERVSFWEPGLLDMDKVRRNHEYAARYCLSTGTYLTMQMQLFTNMP